MFPGSQSGGQTGPEVVYIFGGVFVVVADAYPFGVIDLHVGGAENALLPAHQFKTEVVDPILVHLEGHGEVAQALFLQEDVVAVALVVLVGVGGSVGPAVFKLDDDSIAVPVGFFFKGVNHFAVDPFQSGNGEHQSAEQQCGQKECGNLFHHRNLLLG